MADLAAIVGSDMAVSRGHNRAPVLEVVNLKKHFPVKKGVLRRTVGQVYAVDDVTFSIGEGETLGPCRRVRAAASRPWRAPCCA